MLFNSYVFIFLFLPITLIVYFGLNQRKWMLGSMIWLLFVSLGYYGWWNPIYVLLIVGSMLFNFTVGKGLKKSRETGKILKKRFMIIAGISGNLFLLGYFKYADFLISNVNYLTRSQIPLLHITLPVGISFFTFTQIAYLVDADRGETEEYNLPIYALFVSFFPLSSGRPNHTPQRNDAPV